MAGGENNRRSTTNDQAAICSRSGTCWAAVTFLAARNGGLGRGGTGVLAGSASVDTRSEIKLRIMSAVSIAWFAVSTGQSAEAWCLFRQEHDGRMVSAGITAHGEADFPPFQDR
jgi:hypothetical protein